MHRSQSATVAALTAAVIALAGGALTLPAAASAAAQPAGHLSAAGLASSPVVPAGVSYTTKSTWTWAIRPVTTASGPDQFAQGTITGASSERRRGGFVLRRADYGNQAIVSFSGTRYQVRTFNNGRETLLVDTAFTPPTSGLARVELRGSTLTTTWAGKPVHTLTHANLGTLTGRSTGLAVWQDKASVVTVGTGTTGTLGATPAPAPTTTPAPAPAPTTAPAPAPTTAAPVPAPTTTTPAGVSYTTKSTWTWAIRPVTTASGPDQFAQGTITGASSERRRGGFVLRRADYGNQAIVSFSGTRYQVRTFNNGRETLLVDTAFTPPTSGLARVELRGSTLTTTWAGKPVHTLTHANLGTLTGRSTGLAVWQDKASVVTVGTGTTGTLGATPAPAPTTAPAPAPTTAPAPAPAPTTAPAPAPAPTTAPAPAPTTTAPTAPPAPAPTPPGQGSSWVAPALVDPIVWTPSASHRLLRAPADRDVIVRWPANPLDVVGGFEINGGRNIVSTGGTVKFSKRHFPAGTDDANKNRCLHITGNSKAQKPRTIHVEGLHCAGAYVWEGINIDSKAERGSLTVQLRDITIDGVNAELPGGTGKHYGGDALQAWNGPHRLRVDGFDARNLTYQGFFLQPNSFGTGSLGQWELNDVYLEGARTGHGYLLWLAGDRTGPGAISTSVKDFHIRTAPGRSPAQTVWDLGDDWPDITISRG